MTATSAKRQETLERLLSRYEEVIREGMGRSLWLMAYAEWAEEQNEAAEDDGDLVSVDVPGGGEDWDDFAPETPDAVLSVDASSPVRELVALYVSSNQVRRLIDLFEPALRADSDGQEVSWAAPDGLTSEDASAWDQEVIDLANEFGGDLAMMAMGTGVSWFDDHKTFDLVVPRMEMRYDGDEISWEGEAGTGKRKAVDPPRIEIATALLLADGSLAAPIEVATEVMEPTELETSTDTAVELLGRQGQPDPVLSPDARSQRVVSVYVLVGDVDDHAMQDVHPGTRVRETYTLRGFVDDQLQEIYDRVIREYVVRINGDTRNQSADTFDSYPEDLQEAAIDLVERYALADAYDTVDYGIVWSDDVDAARLVPLGSHLTMTWPITGIFPNDDES